MPEKVGMSSRTTKLVRVSFETWSRIQDLKTEFAANWERPLPADLVVRKLLDAFDAQMGSVRERLENAAARRKKRPRKGAR